MQIWLLKRSKLLFSFSAILLFFSCSSEEMVKKVGERGYEEIKEEVERQVTSVRREMNERELLLKREIETLKREVAFIKEKGAAYEKDKQTATHWASTLLYVLGILFLGGLLWKPSSRVVSAAILRMKPPKPRKIMPEEKKNEQ
jgi:hypothetical protein